MSEQLRPLVRLFEGILASQSFELVKDFLNEKEWSSLMPNEKELLSQLFLLSADQKISSLYHQGEVSGKQEDSAHVEILDCLRAACKLTPESTKVWFRLGSYLALQEIPESLQEAMFAFETSIALDDGFFDAHYGLASSALRYAVLSHDSAYLLVADESFRKASSLSNIEKGDTCPPEFFWHWGITLFLIARDSGEPSDFQRACDLYERALNLGIDKSDFFNDYANCVVELSLLINKEDLLINKAIPLYEESILRLPFSEEGEVPQSVLRDTAVRNFNIACCYQHLFEENHVREWFLKSDKAFQNASKGMPRNKVQFWQKWGQLNLYAGRIFHDIELIEKSLEYFEEAEKHYVELQHESENSQKKPSSLGYALWAQALLIIGEAKGQSYMLSDAYEKAEKAFEIEVELKKSQIHPEVYTALALCLYGFGKYFNEKSYFEKARELIQKGLVEHAKSASLWYALALTKLALGEATGSEISMKESLISFMLASRSLYARFPVFWSDWGIALLHLADWTQDKAFAEEAVLRLEKAIELSDTLTDDAVFNLASAYDLLGELSEDEQFTERAVILFEEMYERGKKDPQTLYQYAVSQLHLGEMTDQLEEYEKARAIFEEYLTLDPEDEVACTEYALCLTNIGVLHRDASHEKLSHNESHSDQCLLDKDDDSCEAGKDHDLGLEIPQEWFLAEEYFLRAASSGFHPALYHLACLYSLMGNYHESIEKLYEAIEVEALPSPEDMLEDEWLHQHLIRTPQFNEFFTHYLTVFNGGITASLTEEDSDEASEESDDEESEIDIEIELSEDADYPADDEDNPSLF